MLDVWGDLPNRFSSVQLDAFVVMPNHVHGIVVLVGARSPRPPCSAVAQASLSVARGLGGETPPLQTQPPTLGQIVAYLKYQTTKDINGRRRAPGLPLWQRNYYEHVVRDEVELGRIRDYIIGNPAKWGTDIQNPDAKSAPVSEPWRV